ncbi:MAG: ATP-dependent helicase [Muribaculaceae bacterium]|nr:ATP-dependent helicase [Muribaculaceae bacterium]
MVFDSSQQAVIDHHGSRVMVLAGPGCGKTRILAERVARARQQHGVAYADMLCLTFTNRAARSMRDRIAARLGELPEGLYVGNLHRFCIRMLHDCGLVSADTAILDEDDAAAFIDSLAGRSGPAWRSEVQAYAADSYMRGHGYPDSLRRRLWFEPDSRHEQAAREYEDFKRSHNLMDFDDCLLWACDALRDSSGPPVPRYSWVQVDEVQDLTPLQMAIVSMLAPAADATVVYLGDEQQAIFDFLGAGADVLSGVRRACGGRIMRLTRNYRSTPGLVELCNSFAAGELGIDPVFLPDPGPPVQPEPDELTLREADSDVRTQAAAALAADYARRYPGQSTAILVRTNAEVFEMHRVLERAAIPHMAVGVADVFRLAAFRMVTAHLTVALNPLRTAEWARILYHTGCVRRADDAAAIVAEMAEAAMTPADWLSSDGMSAVERAVVTIESGGRLEAAALAFLARLLFPSRRGASSQQLLEAFAADAADPTAELQRYLAPMLRARLNAQERLAELRRPDAMRSRLQSRYGELYAHTRQMLACTDASPDNTLSAELEHTYRSLLLAGCIDPIPRWEAVRSLLAGVVTDSVAEPRLREQLEGHLHELSAFNDADIFDRGLAGPLSVLTVHKAKGLEMDNVIVANADAFWGSRLDRARVFYVAFSRARSRLAVFYSGALSPSLASVEDLFEYRSPRESRRLASELMSR